MFDKPLAGKTVAIMVANGFDEVEFTRPQKRLIEAGATVKVVSGANGLVNGWYDDGWGHFFPVDADLADTLAVDFDGLIVPGGIRSVNKMSDEPHAQRVLKAFLREDMPVLLVGNGVKLMITTEDAAGRTVTAPPELRQDLVMAGADWSDDPAVSMGNLVTCSGPDAVDAATNQFMERVAQYDSEVNEAA